MKIPKKKFQVNTKSFKRIFRCTNAFLVNHRLKICVGQLLGSKLHESFLQNYETIQTIT